MLNKEKHIPRADGKGLDGVARTKNGERSCLKNGVNRTYRVGIVVPQRKEKKKKVEEKRKKVEEKREKV